MMEMLAGFVVGLAGSMHCAGMCGPLVAALPSPEHRTASFFIGRLLYNAGRIATYSVLGAIVGLGGSVLSMAVHGQTVSLISGILMIILAMAQLLLHWSVPVPDVVHRLLQPLRARLAGMMRQHGLAAMTGIGMLNGLLPCGMVTAALVGAAGMGSMLYAAGFMTAFGLGTLPIMLALAIGLPFVAGTWRARLGTAAPVMALLMGILIMVRGMGLGIPLLSPPTPKQVSTASCCSGH